MNLWIAWLLTGLVLLILEIFAPGAFMMWLGLAAICVGLLTMTAPMDFAYQVVAFAVFSAASLAVGLRFRRPPTGRLNTQTAGLAGRTVVALAFSGREGRVRLGDSDWAARLPHDAPTPQPGERMRVEGVDGTVLVVRRED